MVDTMAVLDESPLHLDILASNSGPHTCFTHLHESAYSFDRGQLMRIQIVPASAPRGPHYLFVGYHHINTDEDAARLLDCYVTMLDVFVQNSKLAARDVRMFNALEVQSALRMGQGESCQSSL